ncbi:hypothetical protein ACNKHU_22245 [Shigella flexneri]
MRTKISTVARYNGKPAANRHQTGCLSKRPGCLRGQSKRSSNRLSAYFPASLKTVYPYDTTPFIEILIQEVFKNTG